MNQAALELLIQLKDEASAGIAGIGDALSSIGGAAVAGVAVAGAAIGGFLVNAVSEAAEAQDNFSQLEAVIKSTGGAAGVSADEVAGMASALQQTTKFSDDAILKGQSLLLTFTGIGKDVFPDVTKTMLDMSQAMGTDLKGTAMQLGKALNDPIKGMAALSRSGVVFSAEQKEMITTMQEAGDVAGAQRVMLAELQKEFGGSAEAAGKTFSGQLAIAKNMLGEFSEMVGGKILPIITPMIAAFIKFATDALPKVEAALAPLFDSLDYLGKVLKQFFTLLEIGSPEDAFKNLAGGLLDVFGVARGFDDEIIGPLAAIPDLVGSAAYIFEQLGKAIGSIFAGPASDFGSYMQNVLDEIGNLFGQDPPDALYQFFYDLEEVIRGFSDSLAIVLDYISAGFSEDGVIGAISSGLAGLAVVFGASDGAADSFGTSIFLAFTRIQDTVGTVISTIISTVIPMLSQGFSNIIAIVQVVIASVIENWPKIQATIEQVINAIVTNVLPILITVIAGVQEVMQKVVSWVIENWPLIAATVTRVIQAIGNVISVVLPIIKGIFETVFPIIKGIVETAMDLVLGIIKTVMQLITGDTQGALDTLKGLWDKAWAAIGKALSSVFTGIGKDIKGALTGINDDINRDLNKAVDFVNGLGPKFLAAGRALIQGLWDGISEMGGWFSRQFGAWINERLPQFAKDLLGIHSPSQVAAEQIGSPFVAGIIAGIQGELPRLQAAMSQLSGQMVVTPDGARFAFAGDLGGNGQRPTFASSGGVAVTIYADVSNGVDIKDLAYEVGRQVQKARGR